MHGNYTLSDVGLRLIKSYEGFRPVDVELASGQRVVGYGHRILNGKAVHMDKAKAESVLKSDLAPYIAMVNDKVFAPISQGQFDALVSLAFNIGPKRFMESDVLRALNNGRILDAASGFDVWRRAKINGESYVVDALVRRRTAEKILFLRPEAMPLRAPRLELKAAADAQIAALQTHAGERIFEEDGFAETVPYERGQDRRHPDSNSPQNASLMRRREDHAGGVLMLSEVYDGDNVQDTAAADYASAPLVENSQEFSLDIETAPTQEELQTEAIDYAGFDPDRDIIPSMTGEDAAKLEDNTAELESGSPSAIAAAAAEVSGRLDALMAGGDGEEAAMGAGKPDDQHDAKVLPFPSRDAKMDENEASDDDVLGLEAEAALDLPEEFDEIETELPQGDSAARFIEFDQNQSGDDVAADENMEIAMDQPGQTSGAGGPMSVMFILGMILGGASLGAILSGYAATFGVGGEFVASIGVIFGLMLFIGSLYYIFKNRMSLNGQSA